jgi:hypothetical protein
LWLWLHVVNDSRRFTWRSEDQGISSRIKGASAWWEILRAFFFFFFLAYALFCEDSIQLLNMTHRLYWRKFTRDGEIDQDTVADEQFLADNFTDFFGKWLQQGNNAQIQSHDGLVLSFWEDPNNADPAKYNVQTFMVADGGFFDRSKHPDWTWFRPAVRFLTLITIQNKPFFSLTTDNWTLCIVGGARPKETSRNSSFLQVASWNGIEFRFYQNDFANDEQDLQGWNYFGRSSDAFGANAYLGPFNGHVNGACIMKEIHKPWLHWLGEGGAEFDKSYSDLDREAFADVSWLTQPGQNLLSLVNPNPSQLEASITRGINGWFNTRRKLDFFGGSSKLVTNPVNIDRWAAHLFLTTTINLGAAVKTGSENNAALDKADFILPGNHLYDQELLNFAGLTQLMVEPGTQNPFKLPPVGFKSSDYKKAADALQLSLLQQVDPTRLTPDITMPWSSMGGDKRYGDPTENISFKYVAKNFEGLSPFNIIQPSVEDAIGVQRMQMLKKIPQPDDYVGPDVYLGLFSQSVLNAIIMLDFWNPVYSWRRGRIMQYLPQTAIYDGKSYNLEDEFIKAVKSSQWVGEEHPDSPENEFLRLLNVDVETHQKTMLDYLAAVQKRMKDEPVAALTDYLTVAESRRRIYRPLPLNEFGPSLPFALALDPNKPLLVEMKPDGTIQDIQERGVVFLNAWTTSLAGWNPDIFPQSDKDNSSAPVAVSIQALPPPATLSMSCQRVTIAGSSVAALNNDAKMKLVPFSQAKLLRNRQTRRWCHQMLKEYQTGPMTFSL